MAENTTAAMSSVRFCRHKDFPSDHNNVFKCLSHPRTVESLFAYASIPLFYIEETESQKMTHFNPGFTGIYQ